MSNIYKKLGDLVAHIPVVKPKNETVKELETPRKQGFKEQRREASLVKNREQPFSKKLKNFVDGGVGAIEKDKDNYFLCLPRIFAMHQGFPSREQNYFKDVNKHTKTSITLSNQDGVVIYGKWGKILFAHFTSQVLTKKTEFESSLNFLAKKFDLTSGRGKMMLKSQIINMAGTTFAINNKGREHVFNVFDLSFNRSKMHFKLTREFINFVYSTPHMPIKHIDLKGSQAVNDVILATSYTPIKEGLCKRNIDLRRVNKQLNKKRRLPAFLNIFQKAMSFLKDKSTNIANLLLAFGLYDQILGIQPSSFILAEFAKRYL